jgi:hypothetical protein
MLVPLLWERGMLHEPLSIIAQIIDVFDSPLKEGWTPKADGVFVF